MNINSPRTSLTEAVSGPGRGGGVAGAAGGQEVVASGAGAHHTGDLNWSQRLLHAEVLCGHSFVNTLQKQPQQP